MNTLLESVGKVLLSLKRWVHKKTYWLRTAWANPSHRKSLVKDAFLIGIIAFIILSTALVLWAASLKTPDLDSFDDRLLGQSAKIYDRTGTILLYDLSQKVRRTVVPFDSISPYIKNASVSIEDADFYKHKGIKATSIIRAIFANALSLRFSQGGSTITQQVIKNSLLTSKKDISRKIKEWILAVKLEQTTDKNSILNLYLNESSYGGNIYGVEEASQVYFGKKSSDVTLVEAAYLAAIPQAPTYYSPYGKNKAQLVNRKNLVLKKMFENNYINEDEYNKALQEDATFLPKTLGGIKAPHFVMYIKDYLEEKYGDELLQLGGFKVVTTLDYEMQVKAEEIVKKYVLANEKKFKAENGALVVVDPKSGQILTMVGSRDYFDTAIEGNFNVVTAHRQPGSAFKPFVYATAFNKGFTPETPVFDVATVFTAGCEPTDLNSDSSKCYSPQNYEGGYKGLMNFRRALAESRNVPAVKVLYLAGLKDSLATARAMGIEELGTPSQYGLSLVLGGGEVSPLDLTSAYGVFGNDGERNQTTGILKIETSKGETLEEFATSTRRVIPEQTARLMNDVLADRYARAPIFGSRYLGERQVGLKTGTTNNSRDAWIIGYTPNISVGAWMGNNDNKPMAQLASALIVAPMWKEFMNYVLEKIPEEDFERPEPTPSDAKPFMRGAWQGPGNEVHSELYWIDKNNPAGDPPSNPASDPQFRLWEYGVLQWANSPQAQALIVGTTTPGTASTTPSGTATTFTLTYPYNLAVLPKSTPTTITVANVPPQVTRVEYYLNGNLIGNGTSNPFSLPFTPDTTPGILPENELRAVAIDIFGKTQQSTVLFSIQ